jgi:hypothetical protein
MSAADLSPAHVDDTVLVLRARRGGKAAFAVLVERHRPTAVALVSRVLDRHAKTSTMSSRRPPSRRWSAWTAFVMRPALGRGCVVLRSTWPDVN